MMSSATMREELATCNGIEVKMHKLCEWTWEGYLEQVLELVSDPSAAHDFGFSAECFNLLRAALLLKIGRQKEATEIVEFLQQSKTAAAKVLCAVVTFDWDERSTAVDMLFKLLGALERQYEEDVICLPTPEQDLSPSQAPLLDIFGRRLRKDALIQWYQRILALLISCYATTGNYVLAMKLCQRALREESELYGNRNMILIQLARLNLQVGHIEGAREIAESLHHSKDAESGFAVQLLQGMIEYGQSKYINARTRFEKLLEKLSPGGSLNKEFSKKSFYTPDDALGAVFDTEEPIVATLTNNIALCHLNTCNLQGAISALEDCIHQNPHRNMHPSIVFNLCTLYDLAKAKPDAKAAKSDLRLLAEDLAISHRFRGEKDFRMQ